MKKTQMTNEELCLAFQAGDRQAAEQLYLANYSFIHNAIRDVLRKALPHAEKETTHEPREPSWSDNKKRCSPDVSSYEHNPEWIYLQKENTQRIQAAVAKLSVRENAWISVRYGFGDDAPLSHAEAARRYHLTKRRAQKLESSALHNVKTGYMPNATDWR